MHPYHSWSLREVRGGTQAEAEMGTLEKLITDLLSLEFYATQDYLPRVSNIRREMTHLHLDH